MSSIKGVNGGAYDPYESVKNVGNQTPVDSAQSVSEKSLETGAEEPQELREKEKKGLEQMAAERVAEEQIKAQLKKTELADDLNASQQKTDAADEAKKNDRSYFDYHDPDNQPVPFRLPNGEYQRWDVHDKKWK